MRHSLGESGGTEMDECSTRGWGRDGYSDSVIAAKSFDGGPNLGSPTSSDLRKPNFASDNETDSLLSEESSYYPRSSASESSSLNNREGQAKARKIVLQQPAPSVKRSTSKACLFMLGLAAIFSFACLALLLTHGSPYPERSVTILGAATRFLRSPMQSASATVTAPDDSTLPETTEAGSSLGSSIEGVLPEASPWFLEDAGASLLMQADQDKPPSQLLPFDWYELPRTPCGNLLNRCDPSLPRVETGAVCLSRGQYLNSKRPACCSDSTSECSFDISLSDGAHCVPHTKLKQAVKRGQIFATFPKPLVEDDSMDSSSNMPSDITLDDVVDGVFIITMPQRRSEVTQFIKEMKLTRATIVDAVRPQDLPPQRDLVEMGLSCAGKEKTRPECHWEYAAMVAKRGNESGFDLEDANAKHQRILSSVHLSHRKAIQEVANLGGDRWGLIFEDDVTIPPPGVAERLRTFMLSAPADMDMAFPSFCFESFDSARVVGGLNGGPDIYRSKRPLCGTAYILTARAAQRLLDLKIVSPVIDWQLMRWPVSSNVVNAYAPLCPIFDQIHEGKEGLKETSLSGHDNRYPTWVRGWQGKSRKQFEQGGIWHLGSDEISKANSMLQQPNIFIAGMPKCGTSSIYSYLSNLPSVQPPRALALEPTEQARKGSSDALKEVRFFDSNSNYMKNLHWYRRHFPLLGGEEQRMKRLDSTPAYIVSRGISQPDPIERIAAAYGGVHSAAFASLRFVVMIRDPATRMASEWTNVVQTGKELSPKQSFVGDIGKLLKQSLSSCEYTNGLHLDPSCPLTIANNIYARALNLWLSYGVQAEQICLVFTEELISTYAWSRASKRLLRCLGLKADAKRESSFSLPPKNVEKRNPWSEISTDAESEVQNGTSPAIVQLKALYRTWNCELGDFIAARASFGISRDVATELSNGWIPSRLECNVRGRL